MMSTNKLLEYSSKYGDIKMVEKLFSSGGAATLLVCILVASGSAQVGYYFGQNKVLYKDFDWSVFRTEHFDVYYYPEEKQAAQDAARMAERGYAYLSKVLDHQIKQRVPLILYASLNDFQQTNIVSDLLDQGTRGVTESLKNRVVIPLTGSYRELNHVLVHELVHAFQYDLMFKSEVRSKNFNPSLWFVEGMAEYLSVGMDNITRMWVRDGVLNDKLLTVSQLNSAADIRVYRLGESLWNYIGETYGKETVGKIFKTAVQLGDVEQATKKVLGLDSKQLTEKWHQYARKLTVPADSTLQRADQVAEQMTHQEGYYHRLNVVPALGPDGEHVAYVANKDLNEDIYLLSKAKDGNWKEEQLIVGGESKQFETVRYFESSIGWSHDGQRIAFVSKSGKDDALYVMNPFTKEIQQKFVFTELNGIASPTFSPTGEKLAFMGLSGGIADLYAVNLISGELQQLTHDRFAEMQPQWSPKGESIVFVTDRGPETDLEKLNFGSYQLALFDLASKKVTTLTNLIGNAGSPQWSPDGSSIAFISDHQGIPNIYLLRVADGNITPVTALRDAVTGITETTPALSWSADGKVMVFSAFHKQSWNLYRLDLSRSQSEFVQLGASNTDIALAGKSSSTSTARQAWLPQTPDPTTLYAEYRLIPSDSIEARDYKSNFKLDAVSVGGGYDTYWGAVGQAQFLFSDMMGNHNVYLSSALQFTNPLYSDWGLLYLNQGRRITFGIQAFQSNLLYTAFGTYNSVGYLRNTYRGFNAITAYPFSRFSRVELYGGLTWVDQDVVVERYNFTGVDRTTYDIDLYRYTQVGGALVYDNTTYGPLGPTSGSRRRASVETTMMDFRFTNLLADYRRYFKLGHRSVLAWRLMGGASLGRDKQAFGIGGSYTYRGADENELIGSNFLINNLEVRFPLFPFLPANFDWLSAAAYYDAAAAWGIDAPGYSKETFQPFTSAGGFGLKDLKSALGIGARVNLGYFLLQFDIAWPTDLQSFSKPVKLFSIGTYF
jgi:Tol biopolymer transport system component